MNHTITPRTQLEPAGWTLLNCLAYAAIAVVALCFLAGCASIEQAGNSSYIVRNVGGKYELEVKDGKEYAARQVQFQTQEGAAALAISEEGVKAFKGQALAVKALTVLPVTNLGDILK